MDQALCGPDGTAPARRVDWVDYGKGFCIVMVVMMHATLGIEEKAGALGWMHPLVEFAGPFRMPDFFLIAGLFLMRTIDRPWADYLDRKVLHFAYFYALWVTIQFALRAPLIVPEEGLAGLAGAWLLAFVQPFGALWFIYLLPVFFVTVKLVRRVPWWAVLAVAAALHMAQPHTGWVVADEFASRFVFFYAGYRFAHAWFAAAAWADANWRLALSGFALWAVVNGALVFAGWAGLPGVNLLLGLAGACAVIASAALLARADIGRSLRYCGQNSLIIYLAFSPFKAAMILALMKTGAVADIGTMALLVTAAGVLGPLAIAWGVRGTRAQFLFVRPAWARRADAPAGARLQPAE